MKWRISESGDWRPWFAWYPVRVRGYLVWLEWIERRDYDAQWGTESEFRTTTQGDAL